LCLYDLRRPRAQGGASLKVRAAGNFEVRAIARNVLRSRTQSRMRPVILISYQPPPFFGPLPAISFLPVERPLKVFFTSQASESRRGRSQQFASVPPLRRKMRTTPRLRRGPTAQYRTAPWGPGPHSADSPDCPGVRARATLRKKSVEQPADLSISNVD